MRNGLLLILAVLLANAPAFAADSEAAPGKTYVYKQSAGKSQEIEIYFPPGWKADGPKVPGVLLFHGGSWVGGSLLQFRNAAHYFASRGLVAATANYRMLKKGEGKTGGGVIEAKRVCVTDAKSAIRWFKQHADELEIDPQRVIVVGGSAGGHLAVLATTNPGLNDPNDPKEFDTSVVAYVLFNPAFSPDDKGDDEVNVLKHLKATFPPAIMFFGTEDTWKPGADAALQQLKSLGNSSTELWLAEGQKHSFFNKQPWQDITLTAADNFLVERGLLKGKCTLAPPAGGEKIVKAP